MLQTTVTSTGMSYCSTVGCNEQVDYQRQFCTPAKRVIADTSKNGPKKIVLEWKPPERKGSARDGVEKLNELRCTVLRKTRDPVNTYLAINSRT